MVRGVLVCVLAACSAARAAPAPRLPVELARWDETVGIVTASGPDVVVYMATSIAAVARTGGAVRTLATLDDGPARAIYDPVADDARVYWIARRSDAIWSVDRRRGGAPHRLVAAPGRVLSALAIDAGTLIYQEQTSSDAVAIVAVRTDGSHRHVLAAGLSEPTRHAVLHGEVYYGAQSKVWAVALAGGAPRLIAAETAKVTVRLRDPVQRDRVIGTREEFAPITAVAVDEAAVYFSGPRGARRVPRAGGAWTVFPPGIPQPNAQDASAWFAREGARLLRIPKLGGATETLAVAAGTIGMLAVDGRAVYFNVGGALLRLDLD